MQFRGRSLLRQCSLPRWPRCEQTEVVGAMERQMNLERSAPFLSLALSRRSWLFRVRMCIFLPVLVMDGGWVGQCLDVRMRTQTRPHTHTHTHTHTHHTTECSEGGKSAKQAGIGSRSDALIGAAFVPGRDVIMAATVTGSIEVQDCLLRYIQILASERPFASSTCTNKRARTHTHAHALSY